MHNCKRTKDRLTELLLDGVDPRITLANELRGCAECREELASVSETLRATTRSIEITTPPESYWPGYHARLKERLRATQQPRVVANQYYSRSLLKRFFVSSIRVPVPVGLLVVLMFGLAIFLFIRVPVVERVIVHVPIEVPVTQEKIIERVVYREKFSRPPRRTPNSIRHDSALATLRGFKPADDVKLTVIKGGSANEK